MRTDKRYTGNPWTGKHRTWLANQSYPQRAQQIAFQHYCQSPEQIEDRILQLDQEITRLLPDLATLQSGLSVAGAQKRWAIDRNNTGCLTNSVTTELNPETGRARIE